MGGSMTEKEWQEYIKSKVWDRLGGIESRILNIDKQLEKQNKKINIFALLFFIILVISIL